MVARVAPAVVTVYAEGERQVATRAFPDFPLPPGFEDLPRPGRPEQDEEPRIQRIPWTGSGFIISEDGYVLTNNHVAAGADDITIELADGRVFENVEVVGRDPQTDVALLKVRASGLPVTPLGASDGVRVGEWVLAIGSPGFGGIRGPLTTTVTAGIVSAKGRNIDILNSRLRSQGQQNYAIEDFIQTDAVINQGNSGGPLVNAAGEVIGINTAIASNTGSYQGYGFAVPIELAREVIDDLIDYGEVHRALIGVGINDVTAAEAQFYQLDRVAGAVVGSFSFDESPARLGGIEIGDVIVGVEGDPIQGVSELQRRIRSYEPGQTVSLDIVRRSTRKRDVARVKLIAIADAGIGAPTVATRAPGASEFADDPLGIDVRDIDGAARREYGIPDDVTGVVVVDSDENGPLGRVLRQIPPGMVVADVNGVKIESTADYVRAVANLRPGDAASLMIRYGPEGGPWPNQFTSLVIPQR
jgi:serine protease Do